MNKFEVVPHERIASVPTINKRMVKLVLSLTREPQELDLPQNANLLRVEAEGWKLGLWFEIRPPYNTNDPIIYQLFPDGTEIPSFALWKATVLREEVGDPRASYKTAYHLFEYPRGSKIVSCDDVDPESGRTYV